MTGASFAPGFAGSHDVPAHPEAAGFASRAMAFCIDLALLAIFCFILFLLAGRSILQAFPADLAGWLGVSLVVLLLIVALPPLFFFAYFTLLHVGNGQTIGKLLLGLRVVPVEGGELGLGRSFLRTAASVLSALPLGAGFLWAVLDVDHRSWHDLLAGTRVVWA